MKRFALWFSVGVLALDTLTFAQTTQSNAEAAQTPGTATSTAQQPTITPQQGQSAAQQQQDLAGCYEVAKAKTGIDPRDLSSVAAGKLNSIPGMESSSKSATPTGSATPQNAAPTAEKKAMFDKFQLANQGCMEAKGYLVKSPTPTAQSPKQ
jgi:hypothetical protein